jgi:hypothetical protein
MLNAVRANVIRAQPEALTKLRVFTSNNRIIERPWS